MNTTDHFILHDASSNLMAFQTTLLSRLQSKRMPVQNAIQEVLTKKSQTDGKAKV